MIEIKNLCKTYQESSVISLDHVTLDVPDGSIIGLIGINGAGKSTLLRILTGVYTQDGGEARIDGQKIFDNNEVKSQIAFVSDDQYYEPSMTLPRMAKVYAELKDDFSVSKCLQLAQALGLPFNKRLSSFSKGMRRQCDLVMALSSGAKYLFCDETFDGLDPITRDRIKRIVIGEVTDRNATAVIASHNLREMEDFCDRILLLQKGKIVINANIDDLRGSVYKYQFVTDAENGWLNLEEFSPKSLSRSGKVVSFISSSSPETVESKLQSEADDAGCKIIYHEALPLNLEEVFSYQLQESGLLDVQKEVL